MSFLYPEFLFGLFSLAIPVIVHLFNFRKSKKVYFSSTRFLENIKKASSQKLKIKHLLILLARLLFLLFLVLAFAQPFLPSTNKNPQAGSVYIYLDNSSSMSNRVDGTITSLEMGIDYIAKILEIYPENTNYKLLTNEFAPFSNALKSKSEVEELLTELRLSNISRSFPEAYSRLVSQTLLASEQSKDLYIISDFQQSTIGLSGQLHPDTTDQLYIAPVFFDEVKNVSIDSVFLSNPFLVANEKNQINVILRNGGTEEVVDLPVKLFINEIQSASSMVDIPASGTATLDFEIAYNLQNVNKCRISFEDYPVTFDNDFYFVLKLDNKIDILEIRSSDMASPVEQVFGNPGLFNFNMQQAGNIDYSRIRLVDMVIINGLDNIDRSLAQELSTFVAQGGTLCLVPGSQPDLPTYHYLLPGLDATKGDTSQVDMAMPDLSDPFYDNIFESQSTQVDMPYAQPVLSWQGEQMSLLKLKNNLPFLSAFRSEGTIFVFSAPFEPAYTNFHRHALFVPVMYRMATMSKKTFEKAYFEINAPAIRLRLDNLHKQEIFALSNGQSELIPNQRVSTNELILELPKHAIEPGFYYLTLQSDTVDVLAFNRNKAESDLRQLSLEEITSIFSGHPSVSVFDANDADNFSKELKKINLAYLYGNMPLCCPFCFYWLKCC
ncbi:MAG: hypothetical protein HC819_18380 [Cyclobacteriaceae bacterium]|nr:hypothetical protein [Cyclobacteriaceae bacterium]